MPLSRRVIARLFTRGRIPDGIRRYRRQTADAADPSWALGSAVVEGALPNEEWTSAWVRHARDALNWDILVVYDDPRGDLFRVRVSNVQRSRSAFVRQSLGCFQVPREFVCARNFARDITEVAFITAMQIWLPNNLGEDRDGTDAVVQLCLAQDDGEYGMAFDRSERAERMHHRLEWLAIRHTSRVITWSDIAVLRYSHDAERLLGERDAKRFFNSGLRAAPSDFGQAPELVVNELPLPEGLSIPPLLTLRFYTEWVDWLGYRGPRPQEECPNTPSAMRRFAIAVAREYAWALVRGCALERRANERVPVLTAALLRLVNNEIRERDELDEELRQGVTVRTVIADMRRALDSPTHLRVGVTHHLSSAPTWYVPISGLRVEDARTRGVLESPPSSAVTRTVNQSSGAGRLSPTRIPRVAARVVGAPSEVPPSRQRGELRLSSSVGVGASASRVGGSSSSSAPAGLGNRAATDSLQARTSAGRAPPPFLRARGVVATPQRAQCRNPPLPGLRSAPCSLEQPRTEVVGSRRPLPPAPSSAELRSAPHPSQVVPSIGRSSNRAETESGGQKSSGAAARGEGAPSGNPPARAAASGVPGRATPESGGQKSSGAAARGEGAPSGNPPARAAAPGVPGRATPFRPITRAFPPDPGFERTRQTSLGRGPLCGTRESTVARPPPPSPQTQVGPPTGTATSDRPPVAPKVGGRVEASTRAPAPREPVTQGGTTGASSTRAVPSALGSPRAPAPARAAELVLVGIRPVGVMRSTNAASSLPSGQPSGSSSTVRPGQSPVSVPVAVGSCGARSQRADARVPASGDMPDSAMHDATPPAPHSQGVDSVRASSGPPPQSTAVGPVVEGRLTRPTDQAGGANAARSGVAARPASQAPGTSVVVQTGARAAPPRDGSSGAPPVTGGGAAPAHADVAQGVGPRQPVDPQSVAAGHPCPSVLAEAGGVAVDAADSPVATTSAAVAPVTAPPTPGTAASARQGAHSGAPAMAVEPVFTHRQPGEDDADDAESLAVLGGRKVVIAELVRWIPAFAPVFESFSRENKRATRMRELFQCVGGWIRRADPEQQNQRRRGVRGGGSTPGRMRALEQDLARAGENVERAERRAEDLRRENVVLLRELQEVRELLRARAHQAQSRGQRRGPDIPDPSCRPRQHRRRDEDYYDRGGGHGGVR